MLRYFTFLNYSPRGQSQESVQSRRYKGPIKAGRIDLINKIIERISQVDFDEKDEFLNENTVLVPIPKSSLLATGSPWPSRVIAESLFNCGLGNRVSYCIARRYAITKTSSCFTAEARNSVKQHYDSLVVTPELEVPEEITLVDDWVTQGRTAVGSALRLQEAYPDTTIRLFAMFNTRSFQPEIQLLIEPHIGLVSYNKISGLTSRE